jgi:hypothetical protein
MSELFYIVKQSKRIGTLLSANFTQVTFYQISSIGKCFRMVQFYETKPDSEQSGIFSKWQHVTDFFKNIWRINAALPA